MRDGDMRKTRRKGRHGRSEGNGGCDRGGKFSISLLPPRLLAFSASYLLSEASRDCIIEELKLLLCTNGVREFHRVRRDSMNVTTLLLTAIVQRLFG
jgi:hypothetical protein